MSKDVIFNPEHEFKNCKADVTLTFKGVSFVDLLNSENSALALLLTMENYSSPQEMLHGDELEISIDNIAIGDSYSDDDVLPMSAEGVKDAQEHDSKHLPDCFKRWGVVKVLTGGNEFYAEKS